MPTIAAMSPVAWRVLTDDLDMAGARAGRIAGRDAIMLAWKVRRSQTFRDALKCIGKPANNAKDFCAILDVFEFCSDDQLSFRTGFYKQLRPSMHCNKP